MPVCAQPGCPAIIPKAGRCQQHRSYSPTYLERDHAERMRRKRAVDAWVRTHGHMCPGWPETNHEPHPCDDLTAQHTTAVANGGINSPVTILCRSENSRLQHRFD